MAGLLACSKQAKEPFYIEKADKYLYSLEEINYFIYHDIDLIYKDFFDEKLFEFIEKEIDREDIANALRRIKDSDGTAQDFIRYILKESYYYSPNELGQIANFIVNIDSMNEAERLKIKADGLYKQGKYESALNVYFEILNNMENKETNEAFYGRVAYSIGVIYAKLFMSRNANTYFSMAYELYPDTAYAKACVYMAIVNNDEEELLKTIIKYHISDEALETMRMRVRSLRREIETSDETLNFMFGFEDEDKSKKIIENWKEEYYERIS